MISPVKIEQPCEFATEFVMYSIFTPLLQTFCELGRVISNQCQAQMRVGEQWVEFVLSASRLVVYSTDVRKTTIDAYLPAVCSTRTCRIAGDTCDQRGTAQQQQHRVLLAFPFRLSKQLGRDS